jgi:hypothetical protein
MTTPSSTTSSTITPLQSEYIHRAAWKAGVLGALNALTAVLASRLIVLVTTTGAIALTWEALQDPTPYRLGGLAIYCCGAVIPAVWLASARP